MRRNTSQGQNGNAEGNLSSHDIEHELAISPFSRHIPSSKELEVLDRLDLELELLFVHGCEVVQFTMNQKNSKRLGKKSNKVSPWSGREKKRLTETNAIRPVRLAVRSHVKQAKTTMKKKRASRGTQEGNQKHIRF